MGVVCRQSVQGSPDGRVGRGGDGGDAVLSRERWV